jgi:hypothetical protein
MLPSFQADCKLKSALKNTAAGLFEAPLQLTLAADTELDEERFRRNERALFMALGNAQRLCMDAPSNARAEDSGMAVENAAMYAACCGAFAPGPDGFRGPAPY